MSSNVWGHPQVFKNSKTRKAFLNLEFKSLSPPPVLELIAQLIYFLISGMVLQNLHKIYYEQLYPIRYLNEVMTFYWEFVIRQNSLHSILIYSIEIHEQHDELFSPWLMYLFCGPDFCQKWVKSFVKDIRRIFMYLKMNVVWSLKHSFHLLSLSYHP